MGEWVAAWPVSQPLARNTPELPLAEVVEWVVAGGPRSARPRRSLERHQYPGYCMAFDAPLQCHLNCLVLFLIFSLVFFCSPASPEGPDRHGSQSGGRCTHHPGCGLQDGHVRPGVGERGEERHPKGRWTGVWWWCGVGVVREGGRGAAPHLLTPPHPTATPWWPPHHHHQE